MSKISAEEIAATLQGTATLDIQTILDRNDWNERVPDDIEEQVFQLVDLCSKCGWWSRLSDLEISPANEYVCDDCIATCTGCGEPVEEAGEYCGGIRCLELEETE